MSSSSYSSSDYTLYNFINDYNGTRAPSTIHVTNTGLQRYFAKYLFEKAVSVFDWTIPETWDENFFTTVLYAKGYIGVIDTTDFGVIPVDCSLSGYNVMYQPTNILVSNPLLSGILDKRIHKDCEIIFFQRTYTGILDIVNYYADLLTLASDTVGTNLLNSKLSFVFFSKNKTTAESFKKLYDGYAQGEPLAVVDKNLIDELGNDTWRMFNQDVKNSYVVDKVLNDMTTIENMFDTEIGIPNANTMKRERLITDEVNSNNIETESKLDLWIRQLKKQCKLVNDMFNIGIDVKKRFPSYRQILKNVNGGVENDI